MTGSLTGNRFYSLLLGGGITSNELETELANAGAFGYFSIMMSFAQVRDNILGNNDALDAIFGSELAFSAMLQNPSILASIAEDDTLTARVSDTKSAILAVVKNPLYIRAWSDVPANNTRMKNRVNASGSKLKRDTFTTSGSWSIPAGLVALFTTLTGGGGNGGDGFFGSNVTGGGGGGAAELAGELFVDGTLPVSSIAYTVGTPAVQSAWGALIADPGGNGGNIGGTGGGADTNGGATQVSDFDLDNAFWPGFDSFSAQGGDGGTCPPGGAPNVGDNGFDGTGGGIGGNAGVFGGGEGQSLGAGGGAGQGSGASGSAENGDNATVPGAGAGGGNYFGGNSNSGQGGNGADGKIWANYIAD